MATKYKLNVDSPFLPKPLPLPGERTSTNPYGLLLDYLEGTGAPAPLKKSSKGKNIASALGFIGSIIPSKEGASNGTNLTASLVIDAVGSVVSKTPIGAAWYAAYKLGDLFNLNGTATDFNDKENGLTFAENLGNTLTKPIPFIGALGTSVEKNDRSRLAGSHMYAWEGNIDKYGQKGVGSSKFNVLFGGNKIKEGGDKDKININTAIGIRDKGSRDILGASDVFKESQKISSQLTGGWNYINPDSRVSAKLGAILQFSKRTLSKNKIVKQLGGGSIKHRTLDELVDYVEQKNPPFWKRMSGQNKDYIANDDGTVSSLRMTYSSKENSPFVDVYPQVQYDLEGNLHYYFDPIEAYRMAKLHNDVIKMSEEEAKLFTELYKDSTKLKDYYKNYHPTLVKLPQEDFDWEYRTVNGSIPENTPIEEYKEGGKVNVIPEGALHKNKHHLEDVDEKFGEDSITTKGIPVIVESEGGEVIQLAEVERQEIIFRLEVTKKLEELSKKHTDEAAIEAGKLLVKEILYNTEDNTGEML